MAFKDAEAEKAYDRARYEKNKLRPGWLERRRALANAARKRKGRKKYPETPRTRKLWYAQRYQRKKVDPAWMERRRYRQRARAEQAEKRRVSTYAREFTFGRPPDELIPILKIFILAKKEVLNMKRGKHDTLGEIFHN